MLKPVTFSKRESFITRLVCAALLGLALVYCLHISMGAFQALKAGGIANGVVVSITYPTPLAMQSRGYAEVLIDYKDAADGVRHLKIGISNSTGVYSVGQMIKIYYDPANPEIAVTQYDIFSLYAMALPIGILAFLMVGIMITRQRANPA